MLKNIVCRTEHTESQPKRAAWSAGKTCRSASGSCAPEPVTGRHILLIDNLVTTGATLEACGRTLTEGTGVRHSLAPLCTSAHNLLFLETENLELKTEDSQL